MKQKIIVCGGLFRSGSTWQFNVVRRIASLAFEGANIQSGWLTHLPPDYPADVTIIKTHNFPDVSAVKFDLALTSYRDLRDVAGSLVRMGWCGPDWPSIAGWLDDYLHKQSRWRAATDHELRYEDMILDRAAEVRNCLRVVAPALSKDLAPDIAGWVGRLKPRHSKPSGTYTTVIPASQMHNGHLGPSNRAARSFLSKSLIDKIEQNYGEWLKTHGYI